MADSMDIDEIEIDMGVDDDEELQAMQLAQDNHHLGNATTADVPAGPSGADIIWEKVHVAGVDELGLDELRAYAVATYPAGRVRKVEWVTGDRANLVYDSATEAFRALVAFTDTHLDPDAIDVGHLRAAKAVKSHPSTALEVRLALITDIEQERRQRPAPNASNRARIDARRGEPSRFFDLDAPSNNAAVASGRKRHWDEVSEEGEILSGGEITEAMYDDNYDPTTIAARIRSTRPHPNTYTRDAFSSMRADHAAAPPSRNQYVTRNGQRSRSPPDRGREEAWGRSTQTDSYRPSARLRRLSSPAMHDYSDFDRVRTNGNGRVSPVRDLFGSRIDPPRRDIKASDYGRLRDRDRSASPPRDGDGRMGFEDATAAAASLKSRIRTRSASPPSRQRGTVDSKAGLRGRTKQDLMAHLADGSAGGDRKELFPGKAGGNGAALHRRSDAFDAADGKGRDLFSRIEIKGRGGVASSGPSLAERITRGDSKISSARSADQGMSIRGGAAAARAANASNADMIEGGMGHSIKGLAAAKARAMGELFGGAPRGGAGSRQGGEDLFADRLTGGGSRRRKAEDLFA